GPLPLGRADLVETRTVKELRPGLTHVHIERGAWPKEGPPKYSFSNRPWNPSEDPAEFRASMEQAGYTVREQPLPLEGGTVTFLLAGEFDTAEEARQALRKISYPVQLHYPAKHVYWDAGPYILDIVVVDPKVYRGKVTSGWSGRAFRDSPVESARRHNAVVATNGSYFEYSIDEIAGIPTGTSIVQGKWHSEPNNGPALYLENKGNGEISLSIHEKNVIPFPEFKWVGKDGKKKSIKLDGIDRMPKDNELVAMGQDVVDTSPLSHFVPTHILMRQIGDDGYLAKHLGWAKYLRTPGLVLMATGDKQAILNEAMESDKPVELDIRVPDRPGLNAWYVTPILIKDGKPNWKTGQQGRAPRTIIGADAEGKIYLISADGTPSRIAHEGGPPGVGLSEMVPVLDFLGLVNAGNLDGGAGSVSMVIEGKVLGHNNDLYMTSPYDDDRRVGDAVLIIDDE
ncbi:hypothetical protein AXK11_01135, partial [Cephaloticoccus primus]